MKESKPYKTISSESHFTQKEKGSTFLGLAFPVTSLDDFAKFHSELKKKYFDATHICYAFRLMDNTSKFSDDGEPSGTAGKRILNAIYSQNLFNVALFVVRYFGGTKLGVGLLGKTYSECASETLNAAKIKEMHPFLNLEVISGFEFSNTIHHLVETLNAKIIKIEYLDKIHLKILIDPKKEADLRKRLFEATSGTIKINSDEKIIFGEV
ncbi:MAG: YigZ family protein [Ignavibacteriaceae bacterium]|nr:YigZ family protein [Ignavibacteriaceae bacterium]